MTIINPNTNANTVTILVQSGYSTSEKAWRSRGLSSTTAITKNRIICARLFFDRRSFVSHVEQSIISVRDLLGREGLLP